jgi:hypothetical protein
VIKLEADTSPTSVYISGYITDNINNPMEGVSVTFSNGGATVITDAAGYYTTSVTSGWSGTSTATKTYWTFTPASYTYTAVTTNLKDQDFAGKRAQVAIEYDNSSVPGKFTVLPAYPNPFNPSTTITYGIDTDSKITVQIYDITGQLITTLFNTEQIQGWHSVIWNGTNQSGELAPAGLYISQITSGNEVKTKKLMLLK